MIGKRVIPCLLLMDGGLYKTVRFSDPKYVGDPINVVRIFNDKEVDEIVVLDIGATPHQKPIDFGLLEEFASEAFMPLCYGGGVRHIEDVRRLFDTGIEKVSINTAAIELPDLIEEATDTFGSQSIVVSIDVRSSRLRSPSVVTRSATHRTGLGPAEHARSVEARGAGEILLTSVNFEGTGRGYDLDLVREVSDAIEIPLVAHGGAGSLGDLAAGLRSGASAVAAGSLFVFQGPNRAVLISYPTQEEQELALAGSG